MNSNFVQQVEQKSSPVTIGDSAHSISRREAHLLGVGIHRMDSAEQRVDDGEVSPFRGEAKE